MTKTFGRAILFGLIVSLASQAYAQAPAAAVAPAAIAPAAPPTLWSFLGIPQGVKKVQGALTNRRGNLPKTEPKAALKALNDPANLVAENKAIKKAAEVKVAEDLKPQKIKAIKYLTSIGCGCYDKDEEITKALIASAEDCTEDVRLATMQAIQTAAADKCCSNCGQVCCCNEKMLKKLAEIAYERDSAGCYKEPSKRVRDAATLALKTCCPNGEPPCIEPEDPIKVDPSNPPVDPKLMPKPSIGPEGMNGRDSGKIGTEGKSSKDTDPKDNEPADDSIKKLESATEKDVSSIYRNRNGLSAHMNDADRGKSVSYQEPQDGSDSEYEQFSNVAANPNPNGGVVISFNTKTRIAHVHFTDRHVNLVRGDEVYARPGETKQKGFRGRWQVLSSVRGCIRMTPIDGEAVGMLTPGDHVFAGAPPVVVVPAAYYRK